MTAAGELTAAVREARESYELDEVEYLTSGGYAAELLAAAAEQGVAMFVEDEQLLCYPSLVRVLAGDAAIEVDRRRDKRLRPSLVVAMLGAAQGRPPRFKAQPFLESLAGAYELLAAREDKTDPVLRLDAIWGVLTLLPGGVPGLHPARVCPRPIPAGPERDGDDQGRTGAALACQHRHPRRRGAVHRRQDRAAPALLGRVVQRPLKRGTAKFSGCRNLRRCSAAAA